MITAKCSYEAGLTRVVGSMPTGRTAHLTPATAANSPTRPACWPTSYRSGVLLAVTSRSEVRATELGPPDNVTQLGPEPPTPTGQGAL